MPNSLPGTIDYVEIPSTDVTKSRAFFTELLGWTFTDYGSDYVAFEDGRITGGFYRSERLSRTENGGALVVIYTEELEGMKERVLGLGATLLKDIFSFPGGRRFQFAEPGGSEFAIWSEK